MHISPNVMLRALSAVKATAIASILATPLLTTDAHAAAPDTHYVWKGGNHVLPCVTWADACTTIQAAIDTASAGDVVLVRGTPNAEDHFDEWVNQCIVPGEFGGCEFATKTIVLAKAGVSLIGERGPDSTIIDGGLVARGIVLTDEADTLVIEGFTIQNCIQNGLYWQNSGGGILVTGGHSSNLKIRNNILRHNRATGGAAIAIENPSATDVTSLVLEYNVIEDNWALKDTVLGVTCTPACEGGGFKFRGPANSDFVIRGNTFRRNSATSRGGAVVIEDGVPLIEYNTFEGDSARGVQGGGGLFITNDAEPEVRGNTFLANVARRGGAILIHEDSGDVIVARNRFLDCFVSA